MIDPALHLFRAIWHPAKGYGLLTTFQGRPAVSMDHNRTVYLIEDTVDSLSAWNLTDDLPSDREDVARLAWMQCFPANVAHVGTTGTMTEDQIAHEIEILTDAQVAAAVNRGMI
jgi:hypothetical protein